MGFNLVLLEVLAFVSNFSSPQLSASQWVQTSERINDFQVIQELNHGWKSNSNPVSYSKTQGLLGKKHFYAQIMNLSCISSISHAPGQHFFEMNSVGLDFYTFWVLIEKGHHISPLLGSWVSSSVHKEAPFIRVFLCSSHPPVSLLTHFH